MTISSEWPPEDRFDSWGDLGTRFFEPDPLVQSDLFRAVAKRGRKLADGGEAVNPYRIAATEAVRRLLWDVKPESWRSRARLKRLKNLHAGKKAVILCNGPSLKKSNLDLLSGVYCFGLNKIHLLFDETPFRPSCIVAANQLVISQTADVYNATEIPLFLHYYGVSKVASAPNRIFFPVTRYSRKFARDCSISLYAGNTVTFVAMQLAFHMGFSKVALIGCDHYFETKGRPNARVLGGAVDPNHFHPDYFAGMPWELPDLFESEISYQMAYNAFQDAGRQLVNATEGGKLELLPRMSLEAFLRS